MAEIQWLAETSYCSVPIVYRTPGSLWPCMGEYARVIRSFQVQHSGRRNYQLSLNRLAEQWFVDAGVVSQGSALRPLNQPMAQKKKNYACMQHRHELAYSRSTLVTAFVHQWSVVTRMSACLSALLEDSFAYCPLSAAYCYVLLTKLPRTMSIYVPGTDRLTEDCLQRTVDCVLSTAYCRVF